LAAPAVAVVGGLGKMDRAQATALLARLHEAQNRFYGGGDGGGDASAFAELLAQDICWTVPGRNAIAGQYRGLDAVLDYFTRRRAIAGQSFRLHRRDVLVGDGNRIAALTDGTATIAGQQRTWSTVGLYDVRDGQITACWLLPLDQDEFDVIWSGRGGEAARVWHYGEDDDVGGLGR
jgi:ketosteroid isomerase-like protein